MGLFPLFCQRLRSSTSRGRKACRVEGHVPRDRLIGTSTRGQFDIIDDAYSHDFQDALVVLGASHILIKPRHPWQDGKAERFNGTPQEGEATGRGSLGGKNHPSAGATCW